MHIIQTAEQVPLRVELAGLSSRVFAFMIDSALMGAAMGLVLLLTQLFSRSFGDFTRTLMPLLMFLVFFGFHMIQEWRFQGRTFGKILLHIRVVRDNGQPIGFWEAFGRNLLRTVDVYVSGIGLLCMLFSPSEKRFGDYLAGTLVIHDPPGAPLRPVLAEVPASSSASDASANAPAPLAGHLLSLEETELLGTFLSRKSGMQADARAGLTADLCRVFSQRLHVSLQNESDLEALMRSTRLA